MKDIVLKATTRDLKKNNLKGSREEGLVPAVLYGQGGKNKNIWIDAGTKSAISKLEALVNNSDEVSKPVTLGTNWLFGPTVNYYRETNKLDWLKKVHGEGIHVDDDYYYVMEKDLKEIDDYKKRIIQKYDKSNSYLINNSKE
jgi:hypothetical protein